MSPAWSFARARCTYALLLPLLLASACSDPKDNEERQTSGTGPSGSSLPVFEDVSMTMNTRFTHDNAASFEKHLPETMAGGGGFLDYDGDGDLDIYLVQSGNYPGRGVDKTKTNRLLRQRQDHTFEDVTEEAGAGDTGYGFGCQAGDVENDGDADLFVANLGPNTLLRNVGDGTFQDDSAAAGIADPRWATSAAFFDADNDGFLDLYVCNYLAYRAEVARECFSSDNKTRSYCSPTQFDGVDDLLYRNDGAGRFVDVSAAAGILGHEGKGLGVVAADLDLDGRVDLLVANDTTPTLLFRNKGPGNKGTGNTGPEGGIPRFEEDGLMSEVARSPDGVARAGMGIDVADLDGDLWPDFMVTNFSGEVNALYLSREHGTWFEEVSHATGFGAPSYPFLGFGIALTDVEADGDFDALVANGHVLDTIDRTSGATTYRQRPLFLLGERQGVAGRAAGPRFRDIAEELGSVFKRGYIGRGLAVGDYDQDLDEDYLFLQVGARPMLLRNDTPRAGHVLSMKLVGGPSNKDAVGARVTLDVGGKKVQRSIVGGRSYLSMHGRRLTIGLGDASSVDAVEIHWPSGAVEVVANPPVDALLVLEEGRGIVSGG